MRVHKRIFAIFQNLLSLDSDGVLSCINQLDQITFFPSFDKKLDSSMMITSFRLQSQKVVSWDSISAYMDFSN